MFENIFLRVAVFKLVFVLPIRFVTIQLNNGLTLAKKSLPGVCLQTDYRKKNEQLLEAPTNQYFLADLFLILSQMMDILSDNNTVGVRI